MLFLSIFLILLFVCVFGYHVSLFHPFVFDDLSLVVGNPYIKDFKYTATIFQKGLWDFAYEGDKPHYYRPLQTLSFMGDYKVWQLNPFGYHLTNIVLHFLNGLLVAGIIYVLFDNFFIASASSLFFCAHPVNVSTVAYISGRGDLLAATFILATFLFSLLSFKLPKRQKFYFVSAFLCSIAAFLSRENALIIPFMILFARSFMEERQKKTYLLFLSIVLAASFYLYVRFMVLNIPFTNHVFLRLDPLFKLLNFLHLLIRYVVLLSMPAVLYLTHTAIPILSWSEPGAWITLILCAIAFSAVFIKMKNKIIQFSFWWFLISAAPIFFVMASFSSNKLCMAENWIYLAAIGFYVMISYALYILWLRRKTAAYCLIVAFVLTYVCITLSNSGHFKDRISLAGHMLRYDPENEEAHKELAGAYCEKKEYGKALTHIEEAARLDPLDPDMFILKGTYYEDTGRIDLAVTMYETLLRMQPFSARAHNNLGGIYFNQGKLDKAKAFFERAIELNPLLVEPYLNMARLYQHNQKTEEAAGFYLQAIRYNPGIKEGFVNLARMYLEQKNFNGAIDILNKGLRFGHRGGDVLLALGIAHGALGFDVVAERYFTEALKGEPHSEDIILNLGIFYANRGQLNKAIAMWQKGLQSNPGSKAFKAHIEKAGELLSR